jgi:hypothetical protein
MILHLLWRSRQRPRRCYLCYQVELNDALYRDICLRHQLLISWRMFWHRAGKGQWKGMWNVLRWRI